MFWSVRAERGGQDHDHRNSRGLLEPTSGDVEVLGRTWQSHARELREWLGISLQETRLSEKLTVRETLRLFSSFYLHPSSVDAVLEELSLQEKADALVGKLSGGQKQRLAWQPRWWPIRRFSFWTSRRPDLIRKAAGSCGTSSANSRSATARCC